jgi:beta-lactamase superfamily II metal-dependent hydrolase
MADKLLVRAYNVGVGDCIYCRIPKAIKRGGNVDDFHILIDCGSKGSADPLAITIDRFKEMLPQDGAKRHLDLLVVTHEHEDHIKGMDPKVFKDIKIDNIWMNVAMNEEHPQAGRKHKLRAFATQAMRGLAATGLSLSPEVQELVSMYGISNDGAMKALRTGLPDANGIKPKYVHAGMTNDDLDIKLQDAKITVVGPENDIDRFYLGADADERLNALSSTSAAFGGVAGAAGPPSNLVPINISRADFARLQSRILSNALAFANLDGKVTNNTSVVLLIEWKGKRLLFVGDAEWDKKFKEGKGNGAWNTMWAMRKEVLDKPIDFLKIGHHGSVNATPWLDGSTTPTEPSQILDAILPIPSNGKPTARAIVSTARKNYETIPDTELLADIGRRVATVRNYAQAFQAAGIDPKTLPLFAKFESGSINKPQPLRTDCELLLSGAQFVDVEIEG